MNANALSSMIPYGRQTIDEADVQAVLNALRSDFITQGPRIQEFEQKVADYVGAKYAVAFSSGTAALHAAAFAMDIKAGTEAITSPISFLATSNSILFQQGKPVFADVTPDTINLDPDQVLKKMTKRTKAIFAVDFAGHPADMKELRRIAATKKIGLIEDAAHAFGASAYGKKVGSLADITIFSFHPVKHITTGEGGMAVTSNPKIYHQLKLIRSHGVVRSEALMKKYGPWYYQMEALGYNYRITDIQCALGLSQLSKIDSFVQKRRDYVSRYCDHFKGVEEIVLPVEKPGFRSAYHIFVIRLKLDRLKATRRKIFEELRGHNVGVNVHYIPIHLQPYYRKTFGFKSGDFPVAEAYYESAITLPLFPEMTAKAVEQIAATVKSVIDRYRKGEK